MSEPRDESAALPQFERPPLVETATSVQFDEIESFRNAHLALFWNQHLRGDYPLLTDAQLIAPEMERFAESPGYPPRFPSIHFGPTPVATRLQAASSDEYLMVQVQNGRLVFNWRRLGGGGYPRWDTTFPKFQELVKRFQEFVVDEKLGELRANQWEVVYVNHFEKGRDWNTSGDWGLLLPGIVGSPSSTTGLSLESATISHRWEISPRLGRLYVELNHAYRMGMQSNEEFLSLQFLARGPASGDMLNGVLDGLRLGRAAIVKTFVAVTSSEAQSTWGRIR